MRYLKFIIENFKGIRDSIELDLNHLPHSRIFTLVGLNESGKTSILEAINLIQNDWSKDNAHQMIHKSRKSNFSGSVCVTAIIELDESDEIRIREFCKQELDFKVTNRIRQFSICSRYVFEESKYQSNARKCDIEIVGRQGRKRTDKPLSEVNEEGYDKLIDFLNEKLPRILFYRDFLFKFPEKIYLNKDKAIQEKQSEYRDILQDILNSIDETMTIDKHLLSRLKSNAEEDKESCESLIGEMEQKLTDVIMNNWSNVFVSSGNEIVIETGVDTNGFHYLQIKVKQGRDKYSISERSLGFRWFFSFLLFTQFRKLRSEDSGETLFLLDEPASNLHPKAQQRLLSVFDQLTEDCKVVYSTHSQHLIEPKNLPNTYIVRNMAINYDGNDDFTQDDTDIRVYPYRQFVSEYPNETDHFRPVLDAIDYAPGTLEMVDGIVVLEGKNDYYTFKYMEKRLNRDSAMHFYPGAGADKHMPIFELYMAWGKNFWALFDGDQAGIKAKRSYISNLGREIEDRLFTLADIDKSFDGIATEGLFSENDKRAIQGKYFPDTDQYVKSKFNTALQSLYIDDIDIPLDKVTLDNFTRVFNQLDKIIELKKEAG